MKEFLEFTFASWVHFLGVLVLFGMIASALSPTITITTMHTHLPNKSDG